MIIWGSRCWIFLPMQSFKISFHQRSSTLAKFPSVTWLLLFCRAYICSCWRYGYWIRAGKMALAVDDNRPINFVRFKTEVFGCVKISWHRWETCFNFSLQKLKLFSHYLLLSPQTLFVSQGEGLIFWGWSQNPNVVIEKSICLSPW